MRQLVPAMARRQVRQTYYLQGLGRHTPEEQKDFARLDLAAIEKKLGDGPYLLGEKLTVFDFGIASLLAGTLDNQLGTWATALVKEFQPVVDYAGRVQAAVGVYSREVV